MKDLLCTEVNAAKLSWAESGLQNAASEPDFPLSAVNLAGVVRLGEAVMTADS